METNLGGGSPACSRELDLRQALTFLACHVPMIRPAPDCHWGIAILHPKRISSCEGVGWRNGEQIDEAPVESPRAFCRTGRSRVCLQVGVSLKDARRFFRSLLFAGCPFCRSVDFRSVGCRNEAERMVHWIFVPFRCGLCGRHFFLFRWKAPAASTV